MNGEYAKESTFDNESCPWSVSTLKKVERSSLKHT